MSLRHVGVSSGPEGVVLPGLNARHPGHDPLQRLPEGDPLEGSVQPPRGDAVVRRVWGDVVVPVVGTSQDDAASLQTFHPARETTVRV